MGALTWKQAPNPAVRKVIAGMQSEHFNFMGRSVSLGKFFGGYGFTNIFVLLFVTAFLWVMANEPNKKLIALMTILLAIQSLFRMGLFLSTALDNELCGRNLLCVDN